MQFKRSLSAPLALAILLLVMVAPVSSTRAVAATPRAIWQRHVDALAQHPDLVRLYTFDDPATASPSVPNTAGEDAPLIYTGREPLVTVTSDVAEKTCPRLDSEWFQAKPFVVGEQGFTVEMRFRKLGQGSQLGNGRTSGMLLAVDNGYWSGFRIYTSYPDRNLRFEIGRPKPANAFGLTTTTPVPDGGWCHVAATWDRRQMRLYVNGLLAAVTDYDGPYTPGTGMLKVGYANSGIGSLRMDVDEVAIYGSALRPAEVLRHAYYSLPLPDSVATVWDKASSAIVRHDWPAAQLAVMPLRQDATLAAEYRTVAGMVCAESLRQQGGLSSAIAAYSAIFEAPATPPQLRELAAGMCLPPDRRLPFAAASRGVYERLLEQETLAPADRTAVRLCLADRCLDQGDTAAARQQYDLVLGDVVDDSELGPQQRWNVGLRRAHTWVEAGDYAAARDAYMALSTDSTVEMPWRSVAAMCFAETFVREKDYASAEETLLKFAAHTDVTPYFRDEAERRIAEIRRLQRNQPARDPAASRTQIPPLPKPAIQFHVSVDGNDENPGTVTQPFATLPRARDAIRAVKAAGTLPRGGIAVLVHGGQYPMQQTLELQQIDSGTVDSPIVYRAAPGEQPTFSGGVRLSEFTSVREQAVLDRLPAAARTAVRQCDLKQAGVTDFGRLAIRGYGMSGYPTKPWVDLYVDRQAMELARWPNEGRVHVGQVLQGAWKTDQSGRPGIFEYDDDRPASWQQPEKAWMFGAWLICGQVVMYAWPNSIRSIAESPPPSHLPTVSAKASRTTI